MSDQFGNSVQPSSGAPQNGMGVAALVLGIVGFAIGWCFFGIPSILAIIFGALGIKRANQGLATNKSVAQWGMWLGIVGVALGLLFSILFGWAALLGAVGSA
jgi:hypothetical protein